MPLVDPNALTYGLAASLRVPIAARDIESLERHVGPVLEQRGTVKGAVGALLVDCSDRPQKDGTSIWKHPQSDEFAERLFPARQVWVHIDYARYRHAYIKLGMPPIEDGHFLDHVQNRCAIRLRDYSHPYVRLAPVSHRVNTSGGARSGAEGMERRHLESAKQGNAAAMAAIARAKLQAVVYADPLDLTKILNVVPGTFPLDGVRDIQHLFYQ